MITGHMSLNGTWMATYMESPSDCYRGESAGGRRMIPVEVPEPIHTALQRAGLLDDPLYGLNTLKARWVEEQYWTYRRSFEAPPDALNVPAWLVFEKLELNTSVYLNGRLIGTHANAHRPARFSVRDALRPGENRIVVSIESGVFAVADQPSVAYLGYSSLTKRPLRRSPQYQSGWDWTTHLLNVGILGDVRLEWSGVPRLDTVMVYATVAEDLSRATLHVRVTVDGTTFDPASAELRVRILDTGQTVCQPITVGGDDSRHEVRLEIERPRLWWPAGQGDQPLYTLEVTLAMRDVVQTRHLRTGIRRVDVDQSPHPAGGRYFVLQVNRRPIFCKGANWVPPDLFYSAVPAERYRRLVEMAVAANFNMLRVWGGGAFADHALCDACDEAGILIWHDFPFACAQYPGQDPEFVKEVRLETEHAVREMARHPSLVVWCGNNEIETGDWSWGYAERTPAVPHYRLFHHLLPQIVRRENPSVFYWPSSPYSPDGLHPDDPTVGDQHPWAPTWGGPNGTDWWEYRSRNDRFPNEGGVFGVSPPATLRQFLPPGDREIRSPSWDHHDNPFAYIGKTPGEMGLAYKTVRLWTGRDPRTMDWEAYAFVSALLQAEGLAEYILNYRRRKFDSAAAVFWMYNDCWPVVHGWTIVDYYLRRKLAYHPVRRAFQPITVAVAVEKEAVAFFGVNDTPCTWEGELRFGLFTLAGARPEDRMVRVVLPANSSTRLADLPLVAWDALGLDRSGAFALLLREGETVAQQRLFRCRFGDLAFVDTPVSMTLESGRLTLHADTFAWGVCLDLDGERPLNDNCFDLLPGIPYRVPWTESCGRPSLVRIGSRDIPGESRRALSENRGRVPGLCP